MALPSTRTSHPILPRLTLEKLMTNSSMVCPPDNLPLRACVSSIVSGRSSRTDHLVYEIRERENQTVAVTRSGGLERMACTSSTI